MANALTFFYLKSWALVYGIALGIPTFFIMLGAFFFVEKTPIDLLAT